MDLIDRQAAIDAIEKEAYRHTYIEQIIDIINNLPSAQPRPRKGKWMDKGKVFINAQRKVNGEWVSIDIDEIDWENINEIHVKGKYHYFRNRWIPVTERLPEHSGWYLVTQILTEDDDQLVCPKWYPTWSGWYENKQVIAWMPMPEPWKGESNDRT